MRQSPVSFRHLERMTDGTGLLEHCLGKIPRRKEGYTTDDNARALWACAEWLQLIGPGNDREPLRNKLLQLIDRYLSFLLWVQREDGSFHNNIAFDRTPEPEQPSDDCLGRTLWACAVACVKLENTGRQQAAQEMFLKAIERTSSMTFPRGWAYAMAACSLLLRHARRSGEQPKGPFNQFIHSALPAYVDRFEEKLVSLYRRHADREWRWFEPVMTYGNGVIPWGLLHAYGVTEREETRDIAKESLDFLIEKMTGEQGVIRPVGNRGWCTREHRSDWDQQPLDVMKLALAAGQAYVVLGQRDYLEIVKKCRDWYYGDNDLNIALVDVEDGSCCDGLRADGVNENQGAESTLSFLLTEAVYQSTVLEGDVNVCCDRR